MKFVLFVLGLGLYVAGVIGALQYSASFNQEDLNMVYASFGGVGVGAILTILGYMMISKPQVSYTEEEYAE
jgi:hypothetical protein